MFTFLVRVFAIRVIYLENINIWERFTKIAFNDIFYRVILFVFYSFNANFFNNKIIQLLLRIIIINNEGILYKKNDQK